MRVLTVGSMYPPHSLGGYEAIWRSSVRHLRARGHEVRVLASDWRKGEVAEDDPDVHRELRWYWHEDAFPRTGIRERLGYEAHNQRVLRHHLADFEADRVLWWAMGGMSLSLISAVAHAGLPAAGVVGDDWMVYGPRVDAWWRLLRRLGPLGAPAARIAGLPPRVALERAADWLFISQATLRHAREAGVNPASATVAHPGIDPHRFGPAEPAPWGGRLLYAGRLDPRKGIETAIRALERLPDASLAIDGAGDDREQNRLRAVVAQLGLADRVEFRRSPPGGMREAYANADAVLFPVAWEEPWGLVPLEAMAVGRPVVATGMGGSGEYLRDGENCLLFPPGDVAALAASVRRLAADEGLRAALKDGGSRTAAAHDQRAFDAAVELLTQEARPASGR